VVDMEAAPDAIYQLSWEEGRVVHTNHFVEPEILHITEPDTGRRAYSCQRRDRMQSMLDTRKPVSIAGLKDMLSDHAHSPHSICRHEEPAAPVDEQYRTVTGIIMDLQALKLHVTDGPPCDNNFTSYVLPDRSV